MTKKPKPLALNPQTYSNCVAACNLKWTVQTIWVKNMAKGTVATGLHHATNPFGAVT